MSLSVPTRSVRLTCATRRSYLSMNHTILNVSSVIARCKRFTAYLISSLRARASIQQIRRYQQLVDNFAQRLTSRSRHAEHLWKLDCHDMLFCKSPSRAHRKRFKRVACGVAIALVGALCLATEASSGDISKHLTVHEIADKQLTEVQEACHDEITFRESSNNRFAVNGSHHGYYQGRSAYLKGKPDDVQFYWYYRYVMNRYGITEYDEPNYCNALHHLKTKGWQ
jgi:hypothetical protein